MFKQMMQSDLLTNKECKIRRIIVTGEAAVIKKKRNSPEYQALLRKHHETAKRTQFNDQTCGVPLALCRYCLQAEWSESHAQECLFILDEIKQSKDYMDHTLF